MLLLQTFLPDPDGTYVTTDPLTESKLLNITGVEDGVISHVGLPL